MPRRVIQPLHDAVDGFAGGHGDIDFPGLSHQIAGEAVDFGFPGGGNVPGFDNDRTMPDFDWNSEYNLFVFNTFVRLNGWGLLQLGGQALIAEFSSTGETGLFVRLQSWDETKRHEEMAQLMGHRVRVTVEIID